MTKKTGESAQAAEGVPFEASLARLEEIVHQLEDGSLGLSESLARYEEGIQCLQQCHAALEHAERRIQLLTGVDADGNPVTQPFEEGTMSLEEKAAARSRRRSRGGSAAGAEAASGSGERKSVSREAASSDESDAVEDDSRRGRLF